MKDAVCVALVGAGYAAQLHGNGYERVCKVPVRLKTVVDVDLDKARSIQARYGFEQVEASFEKMLQDPEIQVVDIVTPPYLHPDMVAKAMEAGKHVICEKPLTGYFGRPGDQEPIGDTVDKKVMYQTCMEQMDALEAVVKKAPGKFLYSENYVYATPIVRAAKIIRARKSKILFLKGEESLKGSSSPVAGEWSGTGGGSLVRVGCHPLSGVLWLKEQEAKARGEEIRVVSVLADTGRATACLSDYEHRHIAAQPHDVEDFANVTLTFSDGTKAVVMASDLVLGGSKNYVEIYCNDGAYDCHITPTDLLNTYFLDEEGMEDEPLSEMLPQKLGWNKVFVSDEVIRGYMGELQDFMETVYYDRTPNSGFGLARLTTQVLYAAYVSAQEGKAFYL